MSAFLVSPKQIALISIHAVNMRPASYQTWADHLEQNNEIGTIIIGESHLVDQLLKAPTDDIRLKQRLLAQSLIFANLRSFASCYGYVKTLEESCLNQPELKEIAIKLDSKLGSASDSENFIQAIANTYSYFVEGYMIGQSIAHEAKELTTSQYKVYLKSLNFQCIDDINHEFSMANVFCSLETKNFNSDWFDTCKYAIS